MKITQYKMHNKCNECGVESDILTFLRVSEEVELNLCPSCLELLEQQSNLEFAPIIKKPRYTEPNKMNLFGEIKQVELESDKQLEVRKMLEMGVNLEEISLKTGLSILDIAIIPYTAK